MVVLDGQECDMQGLNVGGFEHHAWELYSLNVASPLIKWVAIMKSFRGVFRMLPLFR